MNICWRCKNEIVIEGELDAKRRCPRCAAAMRCCRNCASFVAKSDMPCKESAAPKIAKRELVNECSYFRFKEVRVVDFSAEVSAKRRVRQALGDRGRRPNEMRARLNAAFNGNDSSRSDSSYQPPISNENAPQTAEEAKRRLEELFNK